MESSRSQAVAYLLSFFLGLFGIDRFYMGQVMLGAVKLITLGGFGIWWVVDQYLIGMGIARDGDGAPLFRPRSEQGRSQAVTFLLSSFLGVFGIDRMYLGSIMLGVLKLVTLGGVGLWVVVDVFLVGMGLMRDGEGRALAD